MEKNSSPILTSQDIEEYRQGRVSDRIKEIWGLTFEELSAIMQAHENSGKPARQSSEDDGYPD